MTTLAAFAQAFSSDVTVRTLADARRGQRMRVGHINTPGPLGDRLMELGLTPGTEVDVLWRGAFGGPLRLGVRGTILPLHLDQAKNVEAVLLP
jgi:Fe2+ transport system protein FeoA